jgi:hypothetical protein
MSSVEGSAARPYPQAGPGNSTARETALFFHLQGANTSRWAPRMRELFRRNSTYLSSPLRRSSAGVSQSRSALDRKTKTPRQTDCDVAAGHLQERRPPSRRSTLGGQGDGRARRLVQAPEPA